jgi:hypothetical protein
LPIESGDRVKAWMAWGQATGKAVGAGACVRKGGFWLAWQMNLEALDRARLGLALEVVQTNDYCFQTVALHVAQTRSTLNMSSPAMARDRREIGIICSSASAQQLA